MASYVAADRTQRWKAIVAVAVVHVLLALVIVSGLNVRLVGQAVERLAVFDIAPLPPPRPVPPPPPRQQAMKKPEGAPAKKAEPTPVAAPPTPLVVRSPIPAAKIAGTGSAATSGAAAAGNGSGAGGSGNGSGGSGDYSRFTPARLVRNLTRSDYRELSAGRMPTGRAMVALRVEASGIPSNCRVSRTTGDAAVDAALCPLIVSRLRFRPALDDQGRAIPYQLQYVATWSL